MRVCLRRRWKVALNMEPEVMESQLLEKLDYALNYLKNNNRRVLLVPSIEQQRSGVMVDSTAPPVMP